jgi:AcrR family transcriptional regulator
MAAAGLRERKKLQTRQLIAGAAAALFGERGYEHVSVSDVAKAAEVSAQTVYNYFPAKERLVLDRDDELRDRLTNLIRSRPPGISAAAAIREEAHSASRRESGRYPPTRSGAVSATWPPSAPPSGGCAWR